MHISLDTVVVLLLMTAFFQVIVFLLKKSLPSGDVHSGRAMIVDEPFADMQGDRKYAVELSVDGNSVHVMSESCRRDSEVCHKGEEVPVSYTYRKDGSIVVYIVKEGVVSTATGIPAEIRMVRWASHIAFVAAVICLLVVLFR